MSVEKRKGFCGKCVVEFTTWVGLWDVQGIDRNVSGMYNVYHRTATRVVTVRNEVKRFR